MARKLPPIETRFKKGVSGNPKGRPKKLPGLDDLLVDLLSEENTQGRSQTEIILRRLILQAKKGNIKSAEIVLERAYGKVKQQIEVEETTTVIEVKAKKPPVGFKKEDGKGEKGSG